MEKVKSRLLHEKKQNEESEERRKARDNKRMAKEVQSQKMKERAKQKKDDIESVKKWRKQRQQSGFSDKAGEPELDFESGKSFQRGGGKKRPGVSPADRSGGKGRSALRMNNKKRKFRDSKFGHGGRKGLSKLQRQRTISKVKIDSLKGKKIGLYFSAAWCGPCQQFTQDLVEVYNELSPKVGFEVVFVSGDEDEESFGDYFSKMPWLAVPFTDTETRDRLDEVFKVRGIPNLVMVDDHGKLVNENGIGVIRSYGADAYPFTLERMKEIKEEEDRARKEQTLRSVLVTPSRDFVISRDGNKVPLNNSL